jgi:CubicO group peptidase (beta-lactamase class C family)
MESLAEAVERIAAETRFSGVVRVDRDGEAALVAAYGLADRAHGIPVTPATRFGIASGTKGLTALTVMSLVEDGALELGTTARSLLGDDLPLIDEGVTVEHLLAHRSGIGDYLDEEDEDLDLNAHLLTVPVHRLATTEDYLAVLDGFPQRFPPGERFTYCNGGYVVLALLAERATGTVFHELVEARVCGPAGMTSTAFLRADELPGDVAVGYLGPDGLRSNVLHLPVRGSGDGGVHTTVDDVHTLWEALLTGRILPRPTVEVMLDPRSETEVGRYGLGFWLAEAGDAIILEGADAGVSFRSTHDPERGITATVIGNTTEGAWPLLRHLRDGILADRAPRTAGRLAPAGSEERRTCRRRRRSTTSATAARSTPRRCRSPSSTSKRSMATSATSWTGRGRSRSGPPRRACAARRRCGASSPLTTPTAGCCASPPTRR